MPTLLTQLALVLAVRAAGGAQRARQGHRTVAASRYPGSSSFAFLIRGGSR